MPANSPPRSSTSSPPRRARLLLVPAILLVGATLAIGKNTAPRTRHRPARPPPLTSRPAHETAAPAPRVHAGQRKDIEAIIKDFLLNNPEMMLEVNNVLEAKMDKIQSERMAVAVKENADELFRPAGSPIVGNAKGDVTIIEFFDYNCGYCKKAFVRAVAS